MAYTTIDKPSDYFNTILWSGNSSTNALTGVGFQPDWVWVKERSSISNHQTYDSVRGVQKQLEPNTTGAEGTISTGVTSFDTDGFTVGNNSDLNSSGETYVGWNWLAGTSFTNDASGTGIGTIDSTGSVNNDSGFSIVSYTGNGSSAATVKHGLNTAPKIVIIKRRSGADSWPLWLVDTTQYRVVLNLTNASDSSYSISTSSTIITTPSTVDTHWNGSGDTYIAYCFNDVQGYSKFGSYTGNGNADGTFVYLGFKPAMVILKKSSAAGDNWQIRDNKRSTYNEVGLMLKPNANAAEQASDGQDFLSNGFKIRNSAGENNASGATYIYMAFASSPFVTSTGVPATAR